MNFNNKNELQHQFDKLYREYVSLKTAPDYYDTHKIQVLQEFRTYLKSQVNSIAISRLITWLKIIGFKF